MLTDIKQQSASRLVEVRESLDFIKDNSPKSLIREPNNILISKGLFFVHLYGVYEFTVISTIRKAIEIINTRAPLVTDCKPILFGLAFDPELEAISNVGDKKWEKRWELFKKIDPNLKMPMKINNIVPTNGRNLKFRQLESIRLSFCIAEPILPRPELGGRITELISNRNAIAHGTSSAIEIGSLNTIIDLYAKHNEISEVCSYFISIIEDYLHNEKYLLNK